MRAARAFGALALLVASVRCTPEPGVQAAGMDNFTLSARAPGGDAGVLLAQNAALEDARAFCVAQGKRFMALADRVGEGTFSGDVTYTVRFRCPEPGSPDLPRPTENATPDDRL